MKKSKNKTGVSAQIALLPRERQNAIRGGEKHLARLQADFLKAKTEKSPLLIGRILSTIREALTGSKTAAHPQTDDGRRRGRYLKERILPSGVCSRGLRVQLPERLHGCGR
jgi:hypothetical protein